MLRVLSAILLVGGLVSLLWWQSSEPTAFPPTPETAIGQKGMVVCVSPPACEVGLEILKKGGTSVDAAVAVAFAMAVTYPPAGNIGGGGFMMVHPSDGGKPVCIEYRETAPAAATPDMFTKNASHLQPIAVGVPGTVRGMELAHQRYGKLPWKDLVLPAVKLATEGFPLEKPLADSLNVVLKSKRTPEEFKRVYGPPEGQERWEAGDQLIQPELAETLTLIAEEGPDVFYSGKPAELLITEMKRLGGLIALEDLKSYEAKVREPIHGSYRGYDVYGPPPPSSGGVCLVEMLNILENFELAKQDRWSAEVNHLMIESMRRAYFDRARYLGDADFVEIPDHLTSKKYARQLAEEINPRKATPSEELAEGIKLIPESDSTTHFSIIDKNGLAVSNTYTLEASYGTRIVVPGAGFLLNNEMTDFNHRPGVTTRTGLIGTKPNRAAPGKRMLSSQTPTILAKDGKPVLITGSPGGRTIINTVLNVVVNKIDFDMSLPDVIAAPRLHHQWFPDVAKFEGINTHKKLVQTLRAMGHEVQGNRQGDAHSIWIDWETGTYQGVADQRRIGKALGY